MGLKRGVTVMSALFPLGQPFDRGDSSVEMEALSRVKCLQLRTKR